MVRSNNDEDDYQKTYQPGSWFDRTVKERKTEKASRENEKSIRGASSSLPWGVWSEVRQRHYKDITKDASEDPFEHQGGQRTFFPVVFPNNSSPGEIASVEATKGDGPDLQVDFPFPVDKQDEIKANIEELITNLKKKGFLPEQRCSIRLEFATKILQRGRSYELAVAVALLCLEYGYSFPKDRVYTGEIQRGEIGSVDCLKEKYELVERELPRCTLVVPKSSKGADKLDRVMAVARLKQVQKQLEKADLPEKYRNHARALNDHKGRELAKLQYDRLRRDEFVQAESWLQGAVSGSKKKLCILGPARVGKTTLLDHLREKIKTRDKSIAVWLSASELDKEGLQKAIIRYLGCEENKCFDDLPKELKDWETFILLDGLLWSKVKKLKDRWEDSHFHWVLTIADLPTDEPQDFEVLRLGQLSDDLLVLKGVDRYNRIHMRKAATRAVLLRNKIALDEPIPLWKIREHELRDLEQVEPDIIGPLGLLPMSGRPGCGQLDVKRTVKLWFNHRVNGPTRNERVWDFLEINGFRENGKQDWLVPIHMRHWRAMLTRHKENDPTEDRSYDSVGEHYEAIKEQVKAEFLDPSTQGKVLPDGNVWKEWITQDVVAAALVGLEQVIDLQGASVSDKRPVCWEQSVDCWVQENWSLAIESDCLRNFFECCVVLIRVAARNVKQDESQKWERCLHFISHSRTQDRDLNPKGLAREWLVAAVFDDTDLCVQDPQRFIKLRDFLAQQGDKTRCDVFKQATQFSYWILSGATGETPAFERMWADTYKRWSMNDYAGSVEHDHNIACTLAELLLMGPATGDRQSLHAAAVEFTRQNIYWLVRGLSATSDQRVRTEIVANLRMELNTLFSCERIDAEARSRAWKQGEVPAAMQGMEISSLLQEALTLLKAESLDELDERDLAEPWSEKDKDISRRLTMDGLLSSTCFP